MSNDIVIDRDGQCLVIRLARPEVRNALRRATMNEIAGALDRAERNPDVSSVLLTGGDQWFCSGVDLKDPELSANDDLTATTARLRLVHHLVARVRAFPKPTVAAVEGYAIGIGWALVLACDLAVASRSAFFAQPAAAAGLTADGGLVRMISTTAGHRRAAELLLCRGRIGAPDALDWGLLNALADPGTSFTRGLEYARAMDRIPPAGRFVLCSLLAAARDPLPDDFLAHEAIGVALNRMQPERQAGQAAFLAGTNFYLADAP